MSEFEGTEEEREVQARIGMKVGTYVLRKCLGMGGMGAVYAAEHPTIGSKVAVKFLHRKYAADAGIVDRFFNEARAVNVIGHENLVKVSDLDHAEDGSPYFVMEFLEGRPLAALVGTPQPLEVTGPIFLQACDGLQAAHDKGIVHRDLKPDNLFLVTRHRRGNIVKIVDFGIAKLQAGSANAARTSTGMILGTAHYMSPEQAGGEVNKIGPQSDVYAMGVIMFQLATGAYPFDGENIGQIIVGHLTRPAPDPRTIEPSVPDDFAQVILKCLEKRIDDRFQSMTELYEAIGACLDAHGLSRDPPVAAGMTPSSGGFPAIPSRPPNATPPASAAASRPVSRPSHPGTELIEGGAEKQKRDSTPGFTAVGDRNSSPGFTAAVDRNSTPGFTQVGARSDPNVKGSTTVQPAAFSPMPVAAPEKKKAGGAIVGIVIAVLVVGGIAAFFLMKPQAAAPSSPAVVVTPEAPVAPAPVAAPAPAPAPAPTPVAAPAPTPAPASAPTPAPVAKPKPAPKKDVGDATMDVEL